jgi:hypothetical protein
MLKRLALTASVLMLAAPLAIAQAAPADSTGSPVAQTQTSSPPPTTTAPPPALVRRPTRFGALSGSWLSPRGDFADLVEDGWSITGEGFQFTNPARKVAAGTELGYYDFGARKGPLGVESKIWFVPVDLVLRVFPKSDAGRLSPFVQGGGGFNYVRSEVGGALHTDIEFGAQAGVGLLLHGSGRTALKVDGIYHWIFGGGNGADPEFWSVRGGIVVPMMR